MSGQFQTEPITNSCAFKQRKAGISMPQCPPEVEIEINGGVDYYFWANYSREAYKATYDLILSGDGDFN